METEIKKKGKHEKKLVFSAWRLLLSIYLHDVWGRGLAKGGGFGKFLSRLFMCSSLAVIPLVCRYRLGLYLKSWVNQDKKYLFFFKEKLIVSTSFSIFKIVTHHNLVIC